MRRITIDEVRAACETTGYRLEQGVTLDRERRCGCPLGIIARHESPLSIRFVSDAITALGVNSWYAEGLIDSFDGDDRKSHYRDIEGYDIGYADGSAIRAALLPS